MDNDERNLDLSTLSYTQWIEFFFERPVVDASRPVVDMTELETLLRSEFEDFETSDPSCVVKYFAKMCSEFRSILESYSTDQIHQAFALLFYPPLYWPKYLFDLDVDLKTQIHCIESMYVVFAESVPRVPDLPTLYEYEMWWDIILHDFWAYYGEANPGGRPPLIEDYTKLTQDQQQLLDAIYRTLIKILSIDHRGCQFCALHGFGHLYHPEGSAVVQHYIDTHSTQLSPEDLLWVQACRDGNVI